MSSKRGRRLRTYLAYGVAGAAGIAGGVLGGPVAAGVAGAAGTLAGALIAPTRKTRLTAAAIGGASALVGVAGSAIVGRLSGAGPNSSVINSVGRALTNRGPGLDSNGNPQISDGRRVDIYGRAETVPGSGVVIDSVSGQPVAGSFRSAAGTASVTAGARSASDGTLSTVVDGVLKTVGPGLLGALGAAEAQEEYRYDAEGNQVAYPNQFADPNMIQDPMQAVAGPGVIDNAGMWEQQAAAPRTQTWGEFFSTPGGLLTAAGLGLAAVKLVG